MMILNVKECAEYLRCSVSSVRKMIRNNEIEFFRIGAKINILQDDIDMWIEKCKTKDRNKYNNDLRIRGIRDEEKNKK